MMNIFTSVPGLNIPSGSETVNFLCKFFRKPIQSSNLDGTLRPFFMCDQLFFFLCGFHTSCLSESKMTKKSNLGKGPASIAVTVG